MIALTIGVTLLVRPIDTAHSMATFSVQHVYVERVTGTVPIVDGTVTVDAKTLMPTKVAATLDATKLRTGDDDRDAALQAPDWFDTKKYPEWTFTSTGVTPTGPASCTIEGELTVHGITQPQRLDVTVAGTPDHPEYRAVAHVDRHQFGMSVTRLDPVIGNPVDVTLDVVLK
jgi:polyisoprenoid-binding protein YceI